MTQQTRIYTPEFAASLSRLSRELGETVVEPPATLAMVTVCLQPRLLNVMFATPRPPSNKGNGIHQRARAGLPCRSELVVWMGTLGQEPAGGLAFMRTMVGEDLRG